MRRAIGLLAPLALVVALSAVPATGSDHETPELEPHAHALVIGVELDAEGNPISVRKCVDLAAGKALPLNAQHAHMHVGQAGFALSQHGTFVVPMAPFPAPFEEPVPWTDCESLLASVGL